MKRLLPALFALAVIGCSQSAVVRPSAAAQAPQEVAQEASKCALVQTLMREPLPQQLLALVNRGEEDRAQVVVYLHQPEEAVLERLFVGDPMCTGPRFSVVHDSTREAVVFFLQKKGTGYVYSAQRAAPGELALGTSSKGSVSQRDDGAWVASDVL